MTVAAERRANGFTLIEMLVSLALLGLASLMLSLGIAAAARASARQGARDAALDAVLAAQIVVRQRIEQMAPVTSAQSAEPDVDSRGTATVFDFIGEPIGRVAPSSLQRYRLTRTPGGDLMLYVADTLDNRVDAGDERMVGWTPMRLLSGTAALAIGYYGSAAIGGGRAWQSRWFDRQQPPELVRIQVSFPAGDRRVWPDLLIRPRATMNAACRIDGATGRCAAAIVG